MGHAGTLDPAATGVLPVAVGHATRLLPFLDDSDKAYLATIRFGVESDTGDRDGRLMAHTSADHVTEEDLIRVLAQFTGPQDQVPPMHSAIRVGGRHLYELARHGESIDIPVRHVSIEVCELVKWEPPTATVRIVCSKGTYVRSLARDVGIELGCGGLLANLVRVRAGPFHLASSISIHELEDRLQRHGWERIALHPDFAMRAREIVILAADEVQRWFNGQEIRRSSLSDGDVRVYDSNGVWIGVGNFETAEDCLRPKRVIRESTQ